jgi:hypothetical protein
MRKKPNHCLCDQCKVTQCDKKKNLVKRKQGKTNRNTGRYAEKLFQKWCDDNNIYAYPTIMSGKHKEIADKVDEKKYMFSGDFHIEGITEDRLKVEVKKRQLNLLQRYYSATKFGDVVEIKNFCVLVSADTLLGIVRRHGEYNTAVVEDKKHSMLHGFFNQDNADIVAMIAKDSNRYLDFVFAIKKDVFKKILD